MRKKLDPFSIRTDGGTQMRVEMRDSAIEDYEALFRADEDKFPPIEVFFDGSDHWLAEGFHRVEAAKRANLGTIEAEVHQGTQRDAILFATGANKTNGVERTRADKRKAILTLLEDEEWGKMSDGWVAEKVGVSRQTVATIRDSTGKFTSSETIGRNGKTYQRGEGKKKGQKKDDPEDRVLDGEEVKLDKEKPEDPLFRSKAYPEKPGIDKSALKKDLGRLMREIMDADDGTDLFQRIALGIRTMVNLVAEWERA